MYVSCRTYARTNVKTRGVHMKLKDVLQFMRDYSLLNTYCTTRDVKEIFRSIRNDSEGETSWGNEASGEEIEYEVTFKIFLEFLVAASHFVIRNPYFAVHDRMEKLLTLFIKVRTHF